MSADGASRTDRAQAASDWRTSGSFFVLCSDLEGTELSTQHKVAIAEAFCIKKRVDMKALVEYILKEDSCKLTVELIMALLAPLKGSPPVQKAPRGGEALAATADTADPAVAARTAGISQPAADAHRLPSAAKDRVDHVARQKELLAAYGKKEAAQELEELRTAPDPFDAPGAKEILMHGGAPADELRKKRQRWEKAKQTPVVKKEGGGGGGTKPRPPPRLQLAAWIVAPDCEDELQISAFGTPSPKLRDDDTVVDALKRLLAGLHMPPRWHDEDRFALHACMVSYFT